MKNSVLRNLLVGVAMCFVVFVVSCSKEDPVPAPVATFDGVVSGKVVKFSNSTTSATTYLWDFGDGTTSTEKEPTHTYKSNGSYVVKLLATNKTGSNEYKKAFDIVNIKIDGDVADWKDVPALATYKDGEGGTIKEVKVENLGKDKLFVYIKTTSKSVTLYDMFIDSDNNKATGFASWMYPLSYGMDVVLEGYFSAQDPVQDIYFGTYDDATTAKDKTEWKWVERKPSSNFFKNAKGVKGATDTEIEFAIDMSEFPTALKPKDVINFFLLDVEPKQWTQLGQAPGKFGEATSKALTYTLNL